MNTGGNTGDAVGSVQTDQYRSHTHTVTVGTSAGTAFLNGNTATSSGTKATDASGGNETRPINANVIYCVVTTSLATVTNSNPHGMQIFTSSGTFTIPAGVTSVKVTVVGGGGGGGGVGTVSATKRAGGGGGGGYTEKILTGITPGLTLSVSVGAGGSGGNQVSGGSGGTSSVSSGTQTITTISSTGGAGGTGGNVTTGAPGGAGGTGSGGDFSVSGQAGGISGTVTGSGGSTFKFIGIGGFAYPLDNGNGNSGVGYGGGGSGTGNSGVNSSIGASGSSGIVMFEW